MMRLILMIFLCWLPYLTRAAQIKNFSLPVYDESQRFSLTEAKQAKILVNFWASWCTACVQEVDELNRLKMRYPNVLFIGINAGESRVKIKRFIKKHAFSYLILEDKGNQYAKSIGVLNLPQTFVVDRRGQVLYHGHKPPKEI